MAHASRRSISFLPLPAFLLQAENYNLAPFNPCWPAGYNQRFALGTVYDSPCTAQEKPINFFPQTFVNMSGSGNAAQCLQHVESLFQFSGCPYSRCSFDNVTQPNVEGNFIVSVWEGLAFNVWAGRVSLKSRGSRRGAC